MAEPKPTSGAPATPDAPPRNTDRANEGVAPVAGTIPPPVVTAATPQHERIKAAKADGHRIVRVTAGPAAGSRVAVWDPENPVGDVFIAEGHGHFDVAETPAIAGAIRDKRLVEVRP